MKKKALFIVVLWIVFMISLRFVSRETFGAEMDNYEYDVTCVYPRESNAVLQLHISSPSKLALVCNDILSISADTVISYQGIKSIPNYGVFTLEGSTGININKEGLFRPSGYLTVVSSVPNSIYQSSINYYDIATFSTDSDNLPIFDTYTNAYNYLSIGSLDGLLNDPFKGTIAEYPTDSSIEPPLSLIYYKQFPIANLQFEFSQSEEVEGRQIQIIAKRSWKYGWRSLRGIGSLGKLSYSSSVVGDFVNVGLYNNTATHNSLVIPLSEYEGKFSDSMPSYDSVSSQKPSPSFMFSDDGWFIESDFIYARNIVNGVASDWVAFKTDNGGTSYNVVTTDNNLPTDIVDTEGNNNTGYGSDYWNTISSSNSFDVQSLFGYVQNGLGVVGNSSVIQAVGQTFSFLPRELIAILLFGATVIVVIAIVKLGVS